MGINSFWLFYIEDDSILVSLINWGNGRFFVASIGPRVNFDIDDQESLLKAADESLSSAATSADIKPEEEPTSVGLVVPSSWVGEDGKIVKPKAEIILPLLKKLDLTPSGFISNNDAIIEEANKPDDFAASFINLYITGNSFELSLVYLGKTKKRLKKNFDSEFDPQLVEDCLVELNSESTLPPQIYVYGQADESIIDSLKNFAWIGKKNIETFLHIPDIKLYQDNDLVNIFFKAITSQIVDSNNNLSSHQQVAVEPEVEETEPELEPEKDLDLEPQIETQTESEAVDEVIEENDFSPLEEISSEDLGFISNLPISNLEEIVETEDIPDFSIEEPIKPKKLNFSFKLPKLNIKLPKLKSNFLLFLPSIVLLLVCAPIFLSKANVTLFLTPYEFDKTINVTLDSNASELSDSIIPVDKKTITVDYSTTINTTGQKLVGEKASGEITIFNKIEKAQSIPKGALLIDSKNQQFELMNAVQVASSSSDFATGTMNFGQVKTVVSASSIGPEFNISKDSVLKFKDFPDTSIVVKNNTDFTGGTKQQINAVSAQDKINVEAEIDQKLKQLADEKITQEFNNSNDAIKETIQTTKGKVDLNREIGEETDNLTATAQALVSVFVIKPELKDKIITQFLSKESGFSESEIDSSTFTFTLKIDKLDQNKASGSLNVKGSLLPKINIELLKKNISGKTTKKAQEIIKKTVSRVYDFNIKINFNMINILPIQPKNIFIDIKTESL